MKYHLCCNQLKYRWEVRDRAENILFYGELDEAKLYINKLKELGFEIE